MSSNSHRCARGRNTHGNQARSPFQFKPFSASAVEAPRHFVSQVVRLVPHLARLTTKQQSHCRATMQFAHDRDSAQRHRFSNLSSTQSRNSIITSLLCGLRRHSSIASNLEDAHGADIQIPKYCRPRSGVVMLCEIRSRETLCQFPYSCRFSS